MERTRQLAAYGIYADGNGRIMTAAGALVLPGGPVRHGEHPAAAVVRHVADATGAHVAVSTVLAVHADLGRTPAGTQLHRDRLVFEMTPLGALARDAVAWREPPELTEPPPLTTPVDEPLTDPHDLEMVHRQRFAAYGMFEDPAERVLLVRISKGFPGGGRWHLPGGGTDFGEQPAAGMLRELHEETGQYGQVTELVGVNHRRNPAALGPEGYPIDWHAVRVLYRGLVPVPTEAHVTEAAGGSTAEAAWFEADDAEKLDMTDVAAWGISLRKRAPSGHR